MKKILAVTAVVLIASGAFAQGHLYQNKETPGYGRGGGMGYHYESMTPEQQKEFTKFHDEYRGRMRRSMLDIREVNLKIEREMMKDKPNQNTLSL